MERNGIFGSRRLCWLAAALLGFGLAFSVILRCMIRGHGQSDGREDTSEGVDALLRIFAVGSQYDVRDPIAEQIAYMHV